MQVLAQFGKIVCWHPSLEGWRTHLEEILDPPLEKPTRQSNSSLRLARNPYEGPSLPNTRNTWMGISQESSQRRWLWAGIQLLPPQQSLREGNVFTSVCHSFYPWGVCLWVGGGMCIWVGGLCLWVWGWVGVHPLDTHPQTPHWRHIPIDTPTDTPGHTHSPNTPPTHTRSTSGRYASYCSAFLLNIIFIIYLVTISNILSNFKAV